MRQFLTVVTVFSLINLMLPVKALAVCPVCTIAVGAGLGLSRWLGIDDTVSGLWVGGLLLSSSFWLVDWLVRKGVTINRTILNVVVIALFYLLTLVPLWETKIIGHPFNTIFGFDKLLIGTAVGSILFLIALGADKVARKIHGSQFFIYQKVVFPVSILIVASVIIYLLIPKL